MILNEIECRSAIGKCGFPGGGFAINPYIGCEHGCRYCYARFIRRFTKHKEKWGDFVDVRVNIAEVLRKQLNKKYDQIYIGTVTDPYQPIEEKYQLTRQILEVLKSCDANVSILTKSTLVLRDLDLIKQFKHIDVNFTINSIDEGWVSLIEPNACSVSERLVAAKKLSDNGIKVYAMMGPYFPIFTDCEALFKEFKRAGIKKVYSESFNTVGGNFTEVEEVMRKHYPNELKEMDAILFDKNKFDTFYIDARRKIEDCSKRYGIPVKIHFGIGHAGKFD